MSTHFLLLFSLLIITTGRVGQAFYEENLELYTQDVDIKGKYAVYSNHDDYQSVYIEDNDDFTGITVDFNDNIDDNTTLTTFETFCPKNKCDCNYRFKFEGISLLAKFGPKTGATDLESRSNLTKFKNFWSRINQWLTVNNMVNLPLYMTLLYGIDISKQADIETYMDVVSTTVPKFDIKVKLEKLTPTSANGADRWTNYASGVGWEYGDADDVSMPRRTAQIIWEQPVKGDYLYNMQAEMAKRFQSGSNLPSGPFLPRTDVMYTNLPGPRESTVFNDQCMNQDQFIGAGKYTSQYRGLFQVLEKAGLDLKTMSEIIVVEGIMLMDMNGKSVSEWKLLKEVELKASVPSGSNPHIFGLIAALLTLLL